MAKAKKRKKNTEARRYIAFVEVESIALDIQALNIADAKVTAKAMVADLEKRYADTGFRLVGTYANYGKKKAY